MALSLVPIPDAGGFDPKRLPHNWQATDLNFKRIKEASSSIYYTSNYPSLSTLVTIIGSNNATIFVNSTITLTADVTVPANVEIFVIKGGSFTGAFTLTLNGPFEGGNFQIFTSSITTVWGLEKTICGKWYSSLAKACTALQTGQCLYLHNGDYLLSATIDLSGKSFISIVGETLKGVRIIPNATLGTMFYFNNTEPTTQREICLNRLTFFSDGNYGICDYAIRSVWTPEFHIEECHFINVSKVYSILFSTTFVCTLRKCVGVGRLVFASWGANSLNASAGGGGFYCENTSTTIIMDTCRWMYYTNGVTVNGCDELLMINNAIESCTTNGILINGSCTNLTFQNNYFEGNDAANVCDMRFSATCDSTLIENNFFHGAFISLRFDAAVLMYNLSILSNSFFSASTGIYDAGAYLRQLLVENNTFRSLTTTFNFTHFSAGVSESNRRMAWRQNGFISAPTVYSDIRDMNGEDLTAWTLGSGMTITLDARKYLNDSVWLVTGSNSISRTLLTISATSNLNLRGQWITVSIPILPATSANPTLNINDGVSSRDYMLSAATGVWKQNIVYIQMDAAATALTLSLSPAGDNIYIGRPSVRLGLFDDAYGGASLAFGGFANPTGTIGLTAVPGTALTAPRSDSAPALSQNISPTWTGSHTFTQAVAGAASTWSGNLTTNANGEIDGRLGVGVGPDANYKIKLKTASNASQKMISMTNSDDTAIADFTTDSSNHAVLILRNGSGVAKITLNAVGTSTIADLAGTGPRLVQADTNGAISATQVATFLASLWTKTTSTTLANSTTETTLLDTGVGSKTLTAAFLTIGKTIYFEIVGFYSTTLTPTIQFKFKLGSTTILDSGAITTANTVTNQQFRFRGQMTCRSTGATGSIFAQGEVILAGLSTPLVTITNTAATTIDTTGTLAADITGQWGSLSVSDSITATNAVIEAEG